jgi:asparagine synthase (glutamine-hydrolysing)
MCGIAGYLHFDKDRNASADLLKRMTNILHHRGPDGEGFYVNRNVALGHRRLAIIDLNTGGQPMYNDNGKVVVIFNGEIYNYIELREELVHLGQHFKTESDTEVIVRAYEVWGIDSQKKFNGMWAFALWDDANSCSYRAIASVKSHCIMPSGKTP